jgi:hypothetical protein
MFAARGHLEIGCRRVRPADQDVVPNGPVKQKRVLVDHRDHAADLGKRQAAQVVPADADGPGVGIVEAQQQPHDRGFAAARGADQTDALALADMEVEAVMHGPPGAWIVEADVLERDRRREWDIELPGWRVRHHGRCIEDAIEALGRRQPEHALMQHTAQLAHRSKNLYPEHQDHEQRGQRHAAGFHPQRAERERRSGAAGDRRISDAAGEHIGAEHPHGPAKHLARLVCQARGARRALAERLEGGEPLDRIEEFRRERRIGLLAGARDRGVEAMPRSRRQQCDEREGKHHSRHRQIDHRHDGEDHDRRQGRHRELREKLAEIGFQVVDAVDQRQGERARALACAGSQDRARRSRRRSASQAVPGARSRRRLPPGPPPQPTGCATALPWWNVHSRGCKYMPGLLCPDPQHRMNVCVPQSTN